MRPGAAEPEVATPAEKDGATGLALLEDLAVAAQGGDADAAGTLWGALRPRLLRIGLALGVSPSDVADLVQDSILAAHRSLSKFDPAKGSVEAWLSTILVRRTRNLFRSERRRLGLVARLSSILPRPQVRAGLDAVEARITLQRLLTSLTESQREVVALYEIGELRAEETARLLRITAAGVRSIARDARIRLSEAAADPRPSQEERR